MRYRQKYFIVSDFDGCIAGTFDSSPSGMNVHVASDHAIYDIFGDEGLRVSQEIGGLKNRDPGEFVGLIRQGMRQEGSHKSAEELTEQYVRVKLSYLLPEISLQWPRIHPGVKEFFQACADGRLPLNTSIISAGHDDFIRRVFKIHSIALPDILVTSDLLRARELPRRERYKPYTYQLAEAHYQWERLPVNARGPFFRREEGYTGRAHGKANIAYIGDDPVKDGGLAREARIPFIFVPFTKPGFEPKAEAGQLLVPDFFALKELLEHHARELRDGRTFASIIFGIKDTGIFPEPLENERPFARWLQARTEEYMSTGLRCERGF